MQLVDDEAAMPWQHKYNCLGLPTLSNGTDCNTNTARNLQCSPLSAHPNRIFAVDIALRPNANTSLQ